MSSQVRLRLLPRARCLFDEPVQVKVSGLRSRQVVTMRATSTDERGVVFNSSATYRADGGGEVHLDRDPSLRGSYVGVEPMGLLWSMRADTLHKYFYKNKALNPHVVKFSVHEEEGRMLAEVTNERFLMGDGVSRLPIKEGNIRGVLFTPPGWFEHPDADRPPLLLPDYEEEEEEIDVVGLDVEDVLQEADPQGADGGGERDGGLHRFDRLDSRRGELNHMCLSVLSKEIRPSPCPTS